MRSTILLKMACFVRFHAYHYQLVIEILTSIIVKQCKENQTKTTMLLAVILWFILVNKFVILLAEYLMKHISAPFIYGPIIR